MNRLKRCLTSFGNLVRLETVVSSESHVHNLRLGLLPTHGVDALIRVGWHFPYIQTLCSLSHSANIFLGELLKGVTIDDNVDNQ